MAERDGGRGRSRRRKIKSVRAKRIGGGGGSVGGWMVRKQFKTVM